MSDPRVEIEAVCEIHQGSGRLVVRREGDRIVLDACADRCCVLALENPAVTRLFDALGEWLGVSGPASWVLCATDGTAHLLTIESPNGVVLTTRCGQSLPSGIVQYHRMPSRQLCRECVAAYLLPAPVFVRMTPAGRRSSAPVRSPGGQPVPDSLAGTGCGCSAPVLPRWAWCPVDHGLHLLAHAEAAGAALSGHGWAWCGRRIPAAGLALSGPSAEFCVACVAVGTVR